MKAKGPLLLIGIASLCVAAATKSHNGKLSEIAAELIHSFSEPQLASAFSPQFERHQVEIGFLPHYKPPQGIRLSELDESQRRTVYRLIASTTDTPTSNFHHKRQSVRALNSLLFAMKYPDSPSGAIDEWRFKVHGQPTAGTNWGFALIGPSDHIGFTIKESVTGKAGWVTDWCQPRIPPSPTARHGQGIEHTFTNLITSLTTEQREAAVFVPPVPTTNWPPENIAGISGIRCDQLSSNQTVCVEYLIDESLYRNSPKLLSGQPEWHTWDLTDCFILLSTNPIAPYQRYLSFRIGSLSGNRHWTHSGQESAR